MSAEDLHFSVTGDNQDLITKLRESRNAIKDSGDAVAKEGERMEQWFKRVGLAAATYLSFDFAKSFTGEIIQVTGDMEALQQSFETLLGSKDKGLKMYNDIKEYAIKTPMQMEDLAKGAQTMLGFNIAADKVMPTLKQIGDISMGNSDKFKSLVLAFSQMSATGRLMGQDLLQMINGGFNPLSVISEKTGKSIGQLKDEMEKGAISADMVADAFKAATDEGGKFHGMLESQSEKINGLVSTLKDKWKEVLGSIGNDNKDIIIGGLNLSFKAIEHYKDLIDIIKVLVATYGAYKAALIVTSALQNAGTVLANVRAWMQLAATVRSAKDAQVAFNLATSANPWGAIFAGIALVVSSLYLFTKRQKEANQEMSLHAKTQAEFTEKLKDEQSEMDKLVSLAKNEKASRDDRRKALDKLKESAGGYLDKLTLENIGHKNGADLLRKYNDQLERKYRIEANEAEIKALYGTLRTQNKGIALSETMYNNTKNRKDQGEFGGQVLLTMKKRLDELKDKAKQTRDEINKLLDDNVDAAKAPSGGGGGGNTVDKKAVEKAEKLRQQLQDTIEKDVWDMDADWQKEREKSIDKLLDSMMDSDTKSLDEFVKNQEELAEKFTSIYEGSMSYDQKLDSINRKYTDSIKVMTDAGMLDNVKELKKKWQDEISSLNESSLQEYDKLTGFFTKLYANGSEMSKKTLNETMGNVKKLIAYLKKESTELPDGMKKEMADKLNLSELTPLYNQLISLQEEFNKRSNYPFSNFVNGLKSLTDAKKTYAKASKEVNEKEKDNLNNLAKIQKNYGMAMLTNGAMEAGNALSMVSDALSRIAEASGSESMKETAAQFSSWSSTVGATAQGFASGGPWGGLAAGVTNMLGQTVEAFAQDKAEQAEYLQSKIDFANKLKLLELTLKPTDYENIFGVESVRKAREAYRLAQDALEEYYDSVNKKMSEPGKTKEYKNAGAVVYGGFLGGTKKELTNEYKVLMEAYKKGYTELQGLAVKTKDRSGWANFWGKKDQYKALKDYAPQLWGSDGVFSVEKAKAFLETDKKINDTQRKQIQNVIDLKDAYEANLEIVRKDISETFGGLGTAVTDSIVDAIKNGTDAWENFTKAGSASLETLGKKIAYELFFSDKFDKLQKDLEETYGSGTDSESVGKQQMAILQSFFGNIKTDMGNAQTWMEEWKKQAEAAGFDGVFGETADRTAAAKGFNAMSQDTGNELNGRFTVIQGHTFEMNGNVKAIRLNTDALLDNVIAIKNNTDRLEAIERHIQSTKDGINDISLKGVKIRS
jgi:tape measure domain-containing protein